MFGFKKRRRQRLMQKPFPEAWAAILKQNVPYFRHLPDQLRQKLQGLIQIFLDEKRFEGCGGLEITDEIRLTIAAQACILMLGLDNLSAFYPDLRSVLVYPHHYVAKVKNHHQSFFVEEGFEHRNGESWSHGNIVLAWDEVKRGASDINDGQNLVFHEFAHQLDYESGATDRIESEYEESHYLSWARVMGDEFQNFLRDLKRNQQTLIDAYGATNLSEFFAVVTEYFFEKPGPLKKKHPDLYQQLQKFYRQDPESYT
ncbi:MAG TPA: M90 family metallopeptidase [Balneolaceae bacterium]